MSKVKQECDSCGGTGVYSGFAEPAGTAVVCVHCAGKGWYWHTYKEFTGRKSKRGIKTVSLSRGGFIATGVGAVPGTSMTYNEWKKRHPE